MQRSTSSSTYRRVSIRTRPPLAFLLVRGLYYLATTLAVHLSVLLLRLLTHARILGPHTPRWANLLLGANLGGAWALGIGLLAALLTHSAVIYWTVLVLGLPFAVVIAWHLSHWWRARAIALLPHSLNLGQVQTRLLRVRRPYVVPSVERMKALAVTGASGSGKTTSLTHWIIQDLQHGAGVAVFDPKDDLINTVLGHIPSGREQDVILLDVTDTEHPLGFNPLGGIPAAKRSLATSELVAVLRRYFGDSWGPRMEYILTNVLLALLEAPWTVTLLDIQKLLLDPAYGQTILPHVSNPGVRHFLEVEFEGLRRRLDVTQPILNKVNAFLTFSELRNILGQTTSSFELREVMDQGKILLVRAPQGAVGEQISSLLLALLVTKLQLAAHSRVDTPPDRRRAFFAYVDEFQNYSSSSFERILTEARAFRLGLICANQYPEQLGRDLQLAIDKNAATLVRCREYHGRYSLQLDRLDEVGLGLPPFVLVPPHPLPPGNSERAAYIRDLSRRRYGRPRVQVEQEIWARFNPQSAPAAEPNKRPLNRPAARRRVDIEEE